MLCTAYNSTAVLKSQNTPEMASKCSNAVSLSRAAANPLKLQNLQFSFLFFNMQLAGSEATFALLENLRLPVRNATALPNGKCCKAKSAPWESEKLEKT